MNNDGWDRHEYEEDGPLFPFSDIDAPKDYEPSEQKRREEQPRVDYEEDDDWDILPDED